MRKEAGHPLPCSLRGLGLSLLIHGGLLLAALWFLGQPKEPPKPAPIRWDVSLFEPELALPPPPEERPDPPPELAVEPAMEALPQPKLPSPALPDATPFQPGSSVAAAAPAFAMPQLGASLNTGGTPIAVPMGEANFALPTAETNSTAPGGLVGGHGGHGDLAASGANALATTIAPIVRIPPAYPIEARRKKQEGWVKMEFTVQEDGTVADIKVREASPSGIFDQAAVAAIGQWKFRPAMQNGKAVRKRAVQTLNFALNH